MAVKIPGLNITNPIVPKVDEDIYATHYAKYGNGGWQEVATIEDRDAITELRREAGMAVYVISTNKVYILAEDLVTWNELESGKVDDVKVNGESVLDLETKTANITVPTKVSDLNNDSDFQSQTEVEALISAHNQDENAHENIISEIESITELIPSEATTQNQLADKAYVVNQIATNSTEFRGNWLNWANVPTRAEDYPVDAEGERTPKNKDYMVLRDASDYDEESGEILDGSWRFIYVGDWNTNGKLGWKPQYRIGSTFTPEQEAAINSGATAEKINQIEINKTDISNKLDKITTENQIYATDDQGEQSSITYSKLNGADTIAVRDENGQINVAETPVEDTHAASKKYVDDSVASAGKVNDVQVDGVSVLDEQTKIANIILSDKIAQYDVMPEASSSNAGTVIQYIGEDESGEGYVHGYFYECVLVEESGEESGETYIWQQINVQPASTASVEDVKLNGTSVVTDNIANINLEAKDSEYHNDAVSSITNVQQALDTLLNIHYYQPPRGTFTVRQGNNAISTQTAEIGQTFAQPFSLQWSLTNREPDLTKDIAYYKYPDSVKHNNLSKSYDTRDKDPDERYLTDITSTVNNKTFTFSYYYEDNHTPRPSGNNNKTYSASVTITFGTRRYWGVTTSGDFPQTSEALTAFLSGLSSNVTTGRKQDHKFDCSGGKYWWIGIPTSWVSGISFDELDPDQYAEGKYVKIGSITPNPNYIFTTDITNQFNVTVNYTFYRVEYKQTSSNVCVGVN